MDIKHFLGCLKRHFPTFLLSYFFRLLFGTIRIIAYLYTLIILPKNQLRQEDYDQVSYPLVELGWKIGEQINPIVYTEQEWKANSITPFYDNVQRDAINLL